MQKDNYEYSKTKIDKKILIGIGIVSVIAISLAISIPLILKNDYSIPKGSSEISIDSYKEKVDNKEDFVLFIGSNNNPESNFLLRGDFYDESQSKGEFSNYVENTNMPVYLLLDNSQDASTTFENIDKVYSHIITKSNDDPDYYIAGNFIWFGSGSSNHEQIPGENIDYSNINWVSPKIGGKGNEKNIKSIYNGNNDTFFNYEDYKIYYDNLINNNELNIGYNANHLAVYSLTKNTCKINGSDTSNEYILFNEGKYSSNCYSEGDISISSKEYGLTERRINDITGTKYTSDIEVLPQVMWFGTKPDGKYGIKGTSSNYTLISQAFSDIENYLYE